MPGGERKAYQLVEPILTAISAKADGEPCSTYIGPDGAGHYVKMVHNGIEYAIIADDSAKTRNRSPRLASVPFSLK
jgi:6-phosphogluconate dehydrogenase